MGAPESNAGDDFHFWWAASRALELVRPGTMLRRVFLEGLATVDEDGDSYETVDVSEYFGGDDVVSADRLVLSQLKYSTRYPEQAWTAARLCRLRGRTRVDGGRDRPRSVIRDLAKAFATLVDHQGTDVASKVRIALVTNQPSDPLLLSSVAGASRWIATQSGGVTRAQLLRALADDEAEVITRLADAVGNYLTSSGFCEFLTVLDLTGTGAMNREPLARAVRARLTDLTPGRGQDNSLRLYRLVQEQALPSSSGGGITAFDVLAALGAPDVDDLYPAPARLPDLPHPLPAAGAKTIADAVLEHLGGFIVAHGGAGAGKTTTLTQLKDHLPAGSVVIHFDCYGGGSYLNSGEERHTSQRFALQVTNELAQVCGTPLLVRPPDQEEDLWRRFGRTLEQAAEVLDEGAVLVIAVDAADNAAIAARELVSRGFLPGLARLRLPDRAVMVLTARSHRVESLDITAAHSVEIDSFSESASGAHLGLYFPGASYADVHEFHERSGGNPRSQFYALEEATKHGKDIPMLLESCRSTPEELFEGILQSALQVSPEDAGGRHWLALLIALARPINAVTFATALGVGPSAVTAFAAGLDPGVIVTDGAIHFRDENIETYIRDQIDGAEVTAAHARLAEMFLPMREHDPDAATSVANHLFAAERFDEVIGLVLSEDSPVGIIDGLRRQQVQGRRLDLAARSAAITGDPGVAVRIAARGCDSASRTDTLSRLVESHLDLVAAYADVDLVREHALRERAGGWLGPSFMHLAAAMSRDPRRSSEARSDLANAQGRLRHWMANRDGEAAHWDVDANDVAAAAEARFRLDGLAAAIGELERWQPVDFVLAVSIALARRLDGEVGPEDAEAALSSSSLPPSIHAPFVAYLGLSAPISAAWVNAVVGALIGEPATQIEPWHLAMLDVAVRNGMHEQARALAEHWSLELPTGRWGFASARERGMAVLRCRAVAATLAGAELDIDALVPASLRPKDEKGEAEGRTDDRRSQDRREWRTMVEPLADAAQLVARTLLGLASADEVVEFVEAAITKRLEPAKHRWFTYDMSFRPWAALVAEAVVDSDAPRTVLEQLADVAPELVRDGAPEHWLNLADVVIGRGAHLDYAADLCARAANGARTGTYPAPDRLEIVARAAELAGKVSQSLGENLFLAAVDVAAGINDDAARLLSVHADLAHRADLAATDRSLVASRLIHAAEAVSPHVSESGVVPYEEIVGAASRFDPLLGLSAASRWDDEDRTPLTFTLPDALLGAVDGGGIPAWQALPLDHLIDDDTRRLEFQLEIATRVNSDKTQARQAVARATTAVRRYAPACDQPALARRLLSAVDQGVLNEALQSELDLIAGMEEEEERSPRNTSREWLGSGPSSEAKVLLANPGARTWQFLLEDVAVLGDAYVHGQELANFITAVLQATPNGERVEALATVAGAPPRYADAALIVLAEYLRRWQSWPGVAAWATAALPALIEKNLPELAWRSDTGRLLEQLRSFGTDGEIRNAILLALPEARLRLVARSWQNIAALLGRLCGPADAASALLGLLDDRFPTEPGWGEVPSDPSDALPGLLWAVFGHPRRAVRWRAAHSVRDLLEHPDPLALAPLVAKLMQRLDAPDPGAFRDPSLHFFRFSAMAGLLVALEQVAQDRPSLLRPHLDDLVRHATSREFPHAQIRELARLTALHVAEPNALVTESLSLANRPAACQAVRKRTYAHTDRHVSEERRYTFDQMDTIPYWFSGPARVFDLPVDKIAEFAERWILDRWRLGRDDWFSDARELRDQRSWQRTSHRQGSIPPEENVQLYLDYHAMMAAAGELVDEGRPVLVDCWESDDGDPWEYWLGRHLPVVGPWRSDRGTAVPIEPELFGTPHTLPDEWDTPTPDEHDRAFGLRNGLLTDRVLVAASIELNRAEGRESTYVRSALVDPEFANDLQRALAAASNPHDWKLPDEDEEEFEVNHGPFQLQGWIEDHHIDHGSLDEHDPYAHDLRDALALPGKRFSAHFHTVPDDLGLALFTDIGRCIAQANQWADPESQAESAVRSVRSSGYRVLVDRTALLEFLNQTGTSLIVEVQIERHRSERTGSDSYRPPQSRIYLVDATGTVVRS